MYKRQIPDGYVIKLSKPYNWYIVEVELSTHPIYEHIVTQLSKFINGIENHHNQREITEAIYNEIKKDKVLRAYIETKLGHGEIYHFISKLVSSPPTIVVVIDKINGVREACRVLKQNIRVMEFQTYVRENAPSVYAYIFTPLYESFEKVTLPSEEERRRLFFSMIIDKLKSNLQVDLKEFKYSIRGNVLQIWYERKTIHYEVRIKKSGLIEIGLHLESNRKRNAELMKELWKHKEQITQDIPNVNFNDNWTKAHWCKVYEELSYDSRENLTQPLSGLVERVVDTMEKYIQILQSYI